jgi:hypothetical protein
MNGIVAGMAGNQQYFTQQRELAMRERELARAADRDQWSRQMEERRFAEDQKRNALANELAALKIEVDKGRMSVQEALNQFEKLKIAIEGKNLQGKAAADAAVNKYNEQNALRKTAGLPAEQEAQNRQNELAAKTAQEAIAGLPGRAAAQRARNQLAERRDTAALGGVQDRADADRAESRAALARANRQRDEDESMVAWGVPDASAQFRKRTLSGGIVRAETDQEMAEAEHEAVRSKITLDVLTNNRKLMEAKAALGAEGLKGVASALAAGNVDDGIRYAYENGWNMTVQPTDAGGYIVGMVSNDGKTTLPTMHVTSEQLQTAAGMSTDGKANDQTMLRFVRSLPGPIAEYALGEVRKAETIVKRVAKDGTKEYGKRSLLPGEAEIILGQALDPSDREELRAQVAKEEAELPRVSRKERPQKRARVSEMKRQLEAKDRIAEYFSQGNTTNASRGIAPNVRMPSRTPPQPEQPLPDEGVAAPRGLESIWPKFNPVQKRKALAMLASAKNNAERRDVLLQIIRAVNEGE